MNIVRSFAVGIVSFLCALAVSSFIWLATLQTTVLQRDTVKGWLAQSTFYDRVVPAVLDESEKQPTLTQNTAVTNKLQEAFSETLPSAYMQEQTETIIDKTYDWLAGTTNSIDFAINTPEKRDEFINHAAATLEPTVAALPVCTNPLEAQNLSCRRADLTPAQTARIAAESAASNIPLLNQPLKDEDTSQAPVQNNTTSLPATVQKIPTLLVLLPILALLLAGIVFLLASSKLRALKHISGRIFFGAFISLVLGLVVLYFGSQITLNQLTGDIPSVTTELLQSIARVAIPDIGQQLSLFSGIVAAITGGTWLALFILQRRRPVIIATQNPTAKPPSNLPKPPTSIQS